MHRLALWGHHVDEYQEMFALSPTDLKLRILEYGCGASAVNAELQDIATQIVSYDPWFDQNPEQLTTTVERSFATRLQQVTEDQEKFNVQRYGSLNALIAYRRAGIATFLHDYPAGLQQKRYVTCHAQRLPLADFAFDYALSAHYFFNQHELTELDNHLGAIQELARVAKEVRIYPLIDRQGIPSALLGPVLLGLQQANYGVEIRDVAYHLQPKGNAMLRVWAQQCSVT